ncbi:sulfotransferase [Luteolibacter ambystomatis]|uniref:Sulfotransferase n=1 Tax=Luteolibacter ambystomatis TaxID=2824561 RepID=A0A975G5Q8_9BACT|nr:sulfotransferase [Luteolibacter ambystomatis]QUE49283.1 sulfotransferase [Luteolibacter ambystomatis]
MRAEAEQALQRGDIHEALSLWSLITAGNASPDDLLTHAGILQHVYRSAEAAPLWDRLLAHPDATPDQWLMAAKRFFQDGRFAACARFTARAWQAVPDSPDIAVLHASALERCGELEEAARVASALLAAHPLHPRLVRQLAHLERREGRFETARERLERQLQHHTSHDDWRLRYELAAIYDRLGGFTEAMRELELAKRQIARESAALRPEWRAMTTRQWEVTRGITPERLARWQREAPQPPRRICLMAGFPRSGTTLMEKVLTAHPGCIGTDESGVLATQFRTPIVFGARSTAEVLVELDGYDEASLAAGRDVYFHCTADVLGEEPGDRLLLEKDPLLTPDLALPLRLFPEARILMPLRDPRDVLVSFYFTIVPLAPNSVAAASLADSALYLTEVMRHWLLWRERLDPARWMESRYEDLLAHPEARTRELAAFLGLDWRPEMLAHHQAADARPIGTPTYDDVSKPLYTRSLGRWRNYLPWLEPHLETLRPVLDAFGWT